MYHGLEKYKTNNSYILCENDFEQHLRYITEQGLSCLTVSDLFGGDRWSSVKSCVAITFDDGHASDFELALPLLQKYGCLSTFFITTDWIDRPGYMGGEQIRQLQAAGMSIQSHAKSHNFLDLLSEKEMHRELSLSKLELENILGQRVDYLSCPGGRYNREVVRCAHQVGYRAVFTSVPYIIKKGGEALVVGRHVMRYRAGGSAIKCIVRPSKVDIILKQAVYLGKYILKKSMGNSLYYRLWKRLIRKT
jgi:peptidoglycan/xylan/chitin deacetylase (PgdA/CDA1 family)